MTTGSGWSKEALQNLRRFGDHRPPTGHSPRRGRVGRLLEEPRARLARWTSSPLHMAALGSAVAAVFVVVRLMVVAAGNVSAFIVVGADAKIAQLPRSIIVFFDEGYDGQFYYRLARDPLNWHHLAFGIPLDSPYRIVRIAYPALAWLFSAGHSFLVPTALVVVNVLAFGVVVGCAGSLAHEARRHPAWGLLLAGYWGFLWTIARDLTELVAAAGLLAGLLAIRRNRPLVAGIALSVGVLGRETVLLLVVAIVLTRLVAWLRSLSRRTAAFVERPGDLAHGGPGLQDLVWVLPISVFCTWEVLVRNSIGVFPIRSSGANNRGIPFEGIWNGLSHYLPLLPTRDALIWTWEFLLFSVVVLSAATVFPTTRVFLHERLAWLGYLALTVSLSSDIWTGDVGFRSMNELYLLSIVLLVFSRRRLGAYGALIAATWVAVFVELARAV